MNPLARHTLGGAAMALLLLHCGGSVANQAGRDGGAGQDATPQGDDDAGPVVPESGPGPGPLPPDSGLCEGTPHAGVPMQHRPTAATCGRSAPEGPDAGPPPTCTTDADCVADGSRPVGSVCLQGVCGYDTCLTDADCTSAEVCVCAGSFYGGNGFHGNVCIPATCHVDGDCGAGHYCAPSRGICGSFTEYDCTTGADTCVDPTTDCACGGNSCTFAPQVGHFVCAMQTACNG